MDGNWRSTRRLRAAPSFAVVCLLYARPALSHMPHSNHTSSSRAAAPRLTVCGATSTEGERMGKSAAERDGFASIGGRGATPLTPTPTTPPSHHSHPSPPSHPQPRPASPATPTLPSCRPATCSPKSRAAAARTRRPARTPASFRSASATRRNPSRPRSRKPWRTRRRGWAPWTATAGE